MPYYLPRESGLGARNRSPSTLLWLLRQLVRRLLDLVERSQGPVGLSYHEFEAVVMGCQSGGGLTRRNIREFFNTMDVDGNGTVDVCEAYEVVEKLARYVQLGYEQLIASEAKDKGFSNTSYK